jgi:hypothetical protein
VKNRPRSRRLAFGFAGAARWNSVAVGMMRRESSAGYITRAPRSSGCRVRDDGGSKWPR